MYRVVFFWAICLLTAGCGLAAQREAQAKLATAIEEHGVASKACNDNFSEENSQAIARARCFNDADRAYQPFARFPDLINLRIAKRSELAERQAAGKITRAQASLELAEMNTASAAEEQRRNNNNQSVAAQQQTANAATIGALSANAPRTCTRNGNSVSCF